MKLESVIAPLVPDWRSFMDDATEPPAQTRWLKAFFAAMRQEFGKLPVEAVPHIKTIIFCHKRFWADSPIPYLAWYLGNGRNEVGARMAPIKETQRRSEKTVSDATVIKRLDAWWASGAASGKQVTKRYWHSTPGKPFGRGYFQNTWHTNYEKARTTIKRLTGIDVPTDEDYSLMLDPLVSYIAGFAMSLRGDFTGKALIEYLDGDEFDYHNSRRVVNGDTKNFANVAELCRKFETCIRAAEALEPGWIKTPLILGSGTRPEPIEAPGEQTPPEIIVAPERLSVAEIEAMAIRQQEAGLAVSINYTIAVDLTAMPSTSRASRLLPETPAITKGSIMTKSIFQSKTFWAQVVSFMATVLALFGFDLTAAEQATIVGGIAAIMPVINILLRFITRSSVNLTGSPY